MKNSPRRRLLAAATITASSALLLAACSTPAAEPEEPLETITLTVEAAPIQFEPAYIADRQGFFADAGLEVKLQQGTNPAASLAQILSGEVDIAHISWTTLNTATAEGVPIQLIAGNGQNNPEVDEFGVMVPADSPIKTVADLEGHTLAVTAVRSGIDLPVLLAAEDAGIDPDSITQVAIPYPGMQAALESGAVDAAATSNPFYLQLLGAGYRSLGNFQSEFTPNAPITVWVATTEWLEANEEAATRFVEALEVADEYYNDPANVDEVKGITSEISGVPVEFLAPPVLVSAAINEEGAIRHRNNLERLGYVEELKPFEELIWKGAPRA